MAPDTAPLIALEGITKTYSGITALADAGFTIAAGEAVCLAGENGSGKSTLIKILAGVEQLDRGVIRIAGKAQGALNPRLSAAAGIMVIFQDFSLFPNLSVAENIAFSIELGQRRKLFNAGRVREVAKRTLARVGVDIDPDVAVETLSVAHKQLVAICRALASDARLIIMDEPTTALTEREVRALLDIIRRLKADGVAVLFVSHKLAEVLEVCEKVVVLRNGRKVAEGPAHIFDAASLTRHMTGRDVAEQPPKPLDPAAPLLMRVQGLSKTGAFDAVSFDSRAGETFESYVAVARAPEWHALARKILADREHGEDLRRSAAYALSAPSAVDVLREQLGLLSESPAIGWGVHIALLAAARKQGLATPELTHLREADDFGLQCEIAASLASR